MRELIAKDGNSSDYSCGFYNAMEYVHALLQSRTPYFKERKDNILDRDHSVMLNVDMLQLGKLDAEEFAENLQDLYKKQRVKH